MKDLYNLELNEEIFTGEYSYAKRVPGGWVYIFYESKSDTITSAVFVPYNEEFKK